MSDSEDALRDGDWQSLASAIIGQQCILMLGPQAITAEFDGEQLPVLEGLTRHVKRKLTDEIDKKYAALDQSDPAGVAQAASEAVRDLFTIESWAKEFFRDLEGEGEALAELAELPFDLIVNTSPGPSADRIFGRVKPATKSRFYDRTAPANMAFPELSADAPIVFNLYGSLESPPSLILSDDDRLDFLVSVISNDPPLPKKLRTALKDPRRSFLFLGFDLTQWQLRVLLHVLARNTDRRYRSFAAELGSTGVDMGTRAYYKSGHNLRFFDMDLATFAHQLSGWVERVQRDLATARPSEEPVAPDAPVVFLCHASEDSEIVEKIGAGLRTNGIEIWLDRRDLRGGDEWDPLIVRTITQEVDYVVVVESGNLRSKFEGYVRSEIEVALKRQQRLKRGLAFVIPVVIDESGSELVEYTELKLNEIHSVDMTIDSGLDDLVRAINRDLGKRKPRS